jgi:hypothetical protein
MTKAQARLFQVNKAYDEAHLAINNEYRKRYIETAKAFKLPLPTTIFEHLNMPPEFHEHMEEHQRTCVGSVLLAQEARRTSTRSSAPRNARR